MRAESLAALLSASLIASAVVSGCCGTCAVQPSRIRALPPPPPAPQIEFAGSAKTPREMSIDALANNVKAQPGIRSAQHLADPVTAALMLKALSDALQGLQNVLTSATGDVQAVGNSLEANGHPLLADADARYKDNLDLTYEKLNKEQREIWNAATALTDRVHLATQQLTAQALDSAKVTMWEGDIVAYDTIKELMCRTRDSRALYVSSFSAVTPLALRLGLDPPAVRVRGNFLNFRDPRATIDGVPASVKALSVNEVDLEIPEVVLTTIQTGGAKPVTVAITPTSCQPRWFRRSKYFRATPQSVALLVKPPVTADIDAAIEPTGEVPTPAWWPADFYRSDENCDAHYRVDQVFTLPPDPDFKLINEPYPWRINVTTANCGSGIEPIQRRGDNAILVPGHLDGCGYGPWPIKDCHGRGWLGYHVEMHYNGFVRQLLPVERWSNTTTYGDFDVKYAQQIPNGTRRVRWNYVVRVTLHEGPTSHVVTLTNDVQNSEGIETHFDEGAGRLHIKVPRPTAK